MAKGNTVSVGAMWLKTSKAGNNFFGVSIDLPELLKALGYDVPDGMEKVNLSAFANTKKTSEKEPDHRIVYFLEG